MLQLTILAQGVAFLRKQPKSGKDPLALNVSNVVS